MPNSNQKSIPSKIVSIFWEPSSTFKALKEKCNWWDVLMPLILIVIVSWITIPYVTPIAVQEQISRIENSDRLSEAQKENTIHRIKDQAGSPFAYVTTPVILFIKWVVIAAVIWFAGNFLLGGESPFLPLLGVTAYTSLIDIIASAVKVPLVVSQQTTKIYTGLAILLKQSDSFFFRFAQNLDLFALWKVILLSIGLGVIYKVKTSKAFWIVFIIWLIYCTVAALFGGLVKI